jgi:chromosome segregation ATPase
MDPSSPRPPLGLTFAAVATLGWALAIGFAWTVSTTRAAQDRALRRAELAVTEVKAHLEAQRLASSSLGEVERKVADEETSLARLASARMEAERALLATSEKLEIARRALAATRAEEVRAAERAAGLEMRHLEADRKLAVARAAVTALDEEIGARTRHLAELSRRIDAARRELVEPVPPGSDAVLPQN